MASRPRDEVARNRWMIIQIMRVMGFGLAILGLLMTQDAVDLVGDLNHLVGYVFMATGLIDGFVMPQYLARKWRSPLE